MGRARWTRRCPIPRNPLRVVLQNPGFAATAARKPKLLGAVVRHRLLRRRRAARGLQTPSCLEYAVTYACQARCGHCSATNLESLDRERGRLDRLAVRRLAADARALGVYEVNFTGGEPTLRKDLEELVACFAPRRTFIGVNTNGDLVDAARIRSLRDAGVDLLKLSLDSADPTEHDGNRGLPGNHAHVIDLLRLLRRTPGIRGHVCSVATPDAIRSGSAALLVDLAGRLGATIGFTLPVAVGRWTGTYEHQLEEADMQALRRLCRAPHTFFQGSVGTSSFACPAGREDVYVTPDGEVLPCPFLQRSFGGVDEGLEPAYGRMAEAILRAGDGSLCLAADTQRWMKAELDPRTADAPTCADEHDQGFCRRPVADA